MSFVEKSGKNRWRVRYWRDDGTHGSIPGFPTRAAAEAHARDLDTDRRHGAFVDPHAGTLTLASWADTWFDALDVAPATLAQYRSLIRNHILPRWGSAPLNTITGSAVHSWAKTLRTQGYAPATITTITKIVSMLLGDAAEERLIPANPIRPQRRGRRHHHTVTEAAWATPEQALRVALNATALTGPTTGLLMITAAWTGARWGELTGLHRHNLHLHPAAGPHSDATGQLVIDPHRGALHEVDSELFLGPPKTAESARTIALPPFLIELLTRHLTGHQHPYVFVNPDGGFLRRSNFSRRAMRPAADGHTPKTPTGHRPAVPGVRDGLTFHGFRHSHKTWLIADGIPDVAQARRLGHRIPDKIQHIYSHVAPELETRLLEGLEQRWTHALRTVATPPTGSVLSAHLALTPGTAPPVDPAHQAAS